MQPAELGEGRWQWKCLLLLWAVCFQKKIEVMSQLSYALLHACLGNFVRLHLFQDNSKRGLAAWSGVYWQKLEQFGRCKRGAIYLLVDLLADYKSSQGMSKDNSQSEDCKSVAAGKEAGSTAQDLSLSEASRADLDGAFPAHPAPRRECPIGSGTSGRRHWKNVFLGAVAALFVAVVCYSALDSIFGFAERSQLEALAAQLAQQQQGLAEQQRLTSDLMGRVASLASEPLPSSAAPPQQSEGPRKPTTTKDNPSVVIDISYAANEAGSLPIDPLRRDKQGRSIEEVLYKDDDTRKQRQEFMRERQSFVDSNAEFASLFLAKHNLVGSEEQQRTAVEENQGEWLRLEAKFGLSAAKEELPMCVLVPGFNNNARFRIESNLNSIFSQNYSNYRVVVIDDASTDGSNETYRNYLAFHAIPKQRYTYLENSRRATALENIYLASVSHCAKDSVVVTVDADDELIGRNVLQVFNWAYQTKKAGVVYSNFYIFQQPHTLKEGFTSQYPQEVKKNNLYRIFRMKFSHLRSFRAQLIYQIDPKDLQDENGAFFIFTYDLALFFPLMELSCGRVHKIEGEFHYLYNIGTGLNDFSLDRDRQATVQYKVRMQKKYECFKDFDERMNK